ncbi:hypothetical protein C0995_008795 [Termitomyces sp. Mi166|nr:hypothetical protein C0995_008795 [Termitomyces sp. Mi166\
MSRDPSNNRSVHFPEDVEITAYTPEVTTPVSSSSSVPSNTNQNLAGAIPFEQVVDISSEAAAYRDGIHTELREPSVEFSFDSPIAATNSFHESILNAPATSSRVSSIVITSRSLPWRITISRSHESDGVLTVQDILDGIMTSLQRPAARELEDLRQGDWDKFREVEDRRRDRVEQEGLDDISARQIDWLPLDERVFLGLSREQGSVAGSTERILKVTSDYSFRQTHPIVT